MRNVGVMAVGLLALFVATACVPISELGETGAVATAAPQPVATPNSDTPTPSRDVRAADSCRDGRFNWF